MPRHHAMNVTDLLQIVLRRGWIAAALALAGGLAGLVYAATQTPIYEALSPVRIEAARPADFGQTQAINGVLRSYAADVTTLAMAEQVAEAAPEWEPEALLANAAATADISAREVEVKFKAPDPAEAERIATLWAAAFVAQRREANLQLDERERVFAETRDATTHHLQSPRRKLLAALGAAAGLALGGLLGVALEVAAADRIRTPVELAGLDAGPHLGSVPARVDEVGAWSALRSRVVELAPAAWQLAWPIGLAALLGGALGYGLSIVQPETYRARTRVAIEPARTSDWGQTQAIREIMRGYSEDIATFRMAGQVSERLRLDQPPGAVLERLNVAPNEELYEIWIDIRDRDPSIALAISREWALLFSEDRSRANQELDARDRIYARPRDRTVIETYAPRPMASALAGVVIGGLLGAAAVAWRWGPAAARRVGPGRESGTVLARIPEAA